MTGSTNTGGAGLNLRVIGNNTQPENPTENMIWFNTETRIPHWYFQNDAPSSPSLGDVYVTISTTTTNVLQVLRNNGLKLYFGTARQWDGDSWELVGGKIYYNGSWHNLQTFVYDGTIGDAENNFNHDVGGYPWRTGGGGSISTYNGSFNCKLQNGGNSLCYTNKKIDFSSVSAVKIVYTASVAGYVNQLNAGVFNSASGGAMAGLVASAGWNSAVSKTTMTINTENVSGEYYLGVHMYSTSGGGVTCNFTIYSIELVS